MTQVPSADKTVLIRINGELFRVPHDYIGSKVGLTKAQPGTIPSFPWIDMAIWLPDGAPVTHISFHSLTASGYNRAPKGQTLRPDQHIVRVSAFHPVRDGDGYITPNGRFINMMSYGIETGEVRHGLTTITKGTGVMANRKRFATIGDIELQVLLTCDLESPSGSAAVATCFGDIYDRTQQIAVHCQFLTEHLEDWKRIADLIAGFATQWRNAAK